MKVLVLLSLVALCFATQLYSGKRVTVGEDGTVTIIGTQGREIYISKNLFNPRKVDIVLRSPMGITRKLEVDEINNIMDVNVNTIDKLRLVQHSTYFNTPMDQITQADILAHLFRQYEGIVEEPTFRMILEHIQTLVRSGLVHESVYDILMNLEHLYKIEELKRGIHMMQDGEIMSDIVPKMITKDVYPLEVRDVMSMDEVVPEYMKTPMTFQRLWNMEGLTPYQRFEMLQQIRQQRQMEQTIGDETMTGKLMEELMNQRIGQTETTPYTRLAHEKLMEELMNQRLGQTETTPYTRLAHEKLMQELMNQRLGQTEMTPFTRFMYNMRQGYNKYPEQVPQMQVMGFQKLIQKLKFDKVVPQQWTQGQVVPQQWIQGQVVPQQWTQGQVVPQKWIQGQVVPQQWMKDDVVPQQWTQEQMVPQQVLNHLVGLERMMEQGQILPQEFNMLKQHYQRMMM